MRAALDPILADWNAHEAPAARQDAREDIGRDQRIKALQARVRSAFAEIRAAAVRDFPPKAKKVATRFAFGVERTNRAAMNAQFGTIVPIQVFGSSPSVDVVLHATIHSNAGLITSIPNEQIAQVETVVTQAMDRGARVETLQREIAERFSVSDSKAELIARTETAKFNAALARTRQEDLGIEGGVWSNSHDERVRGNPNGLYPKTSEDHWHLEGQYFRFDDPPVVDEKTGLKALPGTRPNCRCVGNPRVNDVLDALGVSADPVAE